MRPLPHHRGQPDVPSLEVRVCGGDCEPMSDVDLRRLFPGSALTQARLERLRELPRVLVIMGDKTVGAATCQKVEIELRVPDIGIDVASCGLRLVGGPPQPREREIINALLDAVEVACLAAGCQRIILNPPKVPLGFLERRGYTRVDERCAGGWVEKIVDP
jgi:hypothetical protein